MIFLAFLFFNGFISLLGLAFPSLPMDKILPIQMWGNALFLFTFILPSTTAPFLMKI